MRIHCQRFFTLFLCFLLAGCAVPLISAIRDGDTQAMKALLDQGANITALGDCGYYVIQPALVCAAYQNNAEAVKLLLDRGADVNTKDGYGNTALMFAAMRGNANLAQLLLDKGTSVDIVSPFGWSALGYAALGHPHLVKLLIEKGANVDAAIAGLELRTAKYSDPEALLAIKLLMGKQQEIASQRTPPKREEPAPKAAPQPVIEAQGAKEQIRIAVWNLEERNIPDTYAKELTSILVSEIDKLKKYKVHSQENVRTLAGWTAERMQLGCTDSKCLTALGQMDVAKLISGSVGKIGSRYSVSLNLFDTQKTEAERAISEFCRSEDELIELVQVSVRKLLGADVAPPNPAMKEKEQVGQGVDTSQKAKEEQIKQKIQELRKKQKF